MSLTSRGPAFLILFATLMATAGTGISLVTFPWLALQHHGSARDAAIVAAAMTVPLVAATVVAGTAVDFFGRRRISLVADLLSGTAVAGVPLLTLALGTDAITVAVLAVLAGMTGGFDPAGMTARQSMLPEAAARAGWSLDHTNSIFEAVLNLAYILGPGLGGLMIATVGPISTMWITAGAFGLSILAIAALRLEGAGKPGPSNRAEGLMSGITEGLRFVWQLRVLRTLGLVDLAVTALYLPMESVLFPKYFADRRQPAELGWALMVQTRAPERLRGRVVGAMASLTYAAGPLGTSGGRAADRRRRPEGHLPGAGAAHPGDRTGRHPAAVAAGTGLGAPNSTRLHRCRPRRHSPRILPLPTQRRKLSP